MVRAGAYLREFRARQHKHDDAQELTRGLHLRSQRFEPASSVLFTPPGFPFSLCVLFLSLDFLLQQRNDVGAGICLVWSSLIIMLHSPVLLVPVAAGGQFAQVVCR